MVILPNQVTIFQYMIQLVQIVIKKKQLKIRIEVGVVVRMGQRKVGGNPPV